MKITYNKRTALQILRTIRLRKDAGRILARRTELAGPSCEPYQRWSRTRISPARVGFDIPFFEGRPLFVAVPDIASRIHMKNVSSTVYGQRLPPGSFIELGDGCAISGPELLFVEMAELLSPAEHLILGHELCGGFARDPGHPRTGKATMWLPALTSVEKIRRFVAGARSVHGITAARRTLALLSDNAWSPAESIVAAMACLPVVQSGYGLGAVIMNMRARTPEELVATTAAASRVPDIMFEDTKVGINYDGVVHMDLGSIADAAMALAANPGESFFARELEDAMRKVRAKAVDDIRRNRELAADGLTVYPVVKEDLYVPGALDTVMAQVMRSIEQGSKRDLSEQKKALHSSFMSKRRRELLRSLLSDREQEPQQLQKNGGSYEFAAITLGA